MSDDLATQGGGEALPAAVDAPSEPVDRRSAIAAAFEKSTSQLPAESEGAAIQRSRDERGRYAQEAVKAAETAPEAPVEKPARKYPSSWKREAQPLYERVAADPELSMLADEIDRREADFHKGIEGYKTKAQFAESMEQAIAPFQATLASMGVQPAQAVQALFAADHRLRYGQPHEKAQAFQQLAEAYGVDLGAVGQQAQVDPQYQAVLDELNQLKAQQYQWMQSQQQAQQSTVLSEIDKFSRDKPHFEAVREDMAALLQGGRAESLDQAYEMACWARGDIRPSLIEQQRKDEEAKRKEEAQRAVAAAKSAAVQVRGAPTGGPSNPSVTDRRAQIAAAFDRSRI